MRSVTPTCTWWSEGRRGPNREGKGETQSWARETEDEALTGTGKDVQVSGFTLVPET